MIQVTLGKRLVECSFADRVFFTNSGTEANEAAIKFSRKFQRHSHPEEKFPATEFIAFSNSFHGRTLGALALTSKEHYRLPFEPVMPGVTFVEYGNIKEALKAIQSGKTAAVFVEPIQGEGGIFSATKDFLQLLRTACDDSGALLVFDEVSSLDHASIYINTYYDVLHTSFPFRRKKQSHTGNALGCKTYLFALLLRSSIILLKPSAFSDSKFYLSIELI